MALTPHKRGTEREACVSMVMSVWMSVKKPKLSTSPIPLEHVVALRVATMTPNAVGGDQHWSCDAECKTWVIRPQSVVGVLGIESCEKGLEHTSVKLTEDSVELLEQLRAVQDWWPHFDEQQAGGGKKPGKKAVKRNHLGLFVQRQGRPKRFIDKVKAKAKAKAAVKAKAKAGPARGVIKAAMKAAPKAKAKACGVVRRRKRCQ